MDKHKDFVFIGPDRRPHRVKSYGPKGEYWVFWWHPDKYWVTDMVINSLSAELFETLALPPEQGRLYDPKSWDN